jgi:hypothetical protein
LQGFFVPNPGERIALAAVCFAVRSFENVRDPELLANVVYLTGNVQGHLFPFDGARACYEEKLTGIGVLEAREMDHG